MEIGELWVDPADEAIMLFVGQDPDSPVTRHGFYCSFHGRVYYYSNHDLKYLRRV